MKRISNITERQSVLSLKVTRQMRKVVEQLAASMTVKYGVRHTLTDVVERAIRLLELDESRR